MRIITILLFSLFLLGCAAIPYEEAKVDAVEVNKLITELDIYNEEFEEFLKTNGYPSNNLPIKDWGLRELLLAQLFFNYDIKNAKASLDWVRTSENIALLYPPSSIGIEIGRGDSEEELSKNIFGGGFNFTFESANKRLIRYEIAFNETQSAALQYELKIWDARAKLLEQIVNLLERQDLITITKDELRSKHSILQMIKKRVGVGILSQVQLDRVTLELSAINQMLLNLQYDQEKVRNEIATSVGLSLEKFNLIPVNTQKIKAMFNKASADFVAENEVGNIKYKATTNSKMLRILLANYAVAESLLKYEIAKQYPDFNFSPAYTYDLGNYIWNIGIETIISSTDRNKVYIERAKKLRETEATKVLSYQIEIINAAERLLDDFSYGLALKRDVEEMRETKNNLKKQLVKRFDNGILDRLELELELIKFNEIERSYHKALYNVMRKGLFAESTVQEPIFTEQFN